MGVPESGVGRCVRDGKTGTVGVGGGDMGEIIVGVGGGDMGDVGGELKSVNARASEWSNPHVSPATAANRTIIEMIHRAIILSFIFHAPIL